MAGSLQTQEAQHEASLSKLRADLQLEHCQYLEELERKFQKKEKENQLGCDVSSSCYCASQGHNLKVDDTHTESREESLSSSLF